MRYRHCVFLVSVVSSTASAMFSLGNLTRLDCSQLHISIALSEACSSSDIVRACFVAYSCDMDSTRLKEHFTLYGEEGLTKVIHQNFYLAVFLLIVYMIVLTNSPHVYFTAYFLFWRIDLLDSL